jgi:hypothetical protein
VRGVEQRWTRQARRNNKKNTRKGEKKGQGHRAEVEGTGDKNKKNKPEKQQTKTKKH